MTMADKKTPALAFGFAALAIGLKAKAGPVPPHKQRDFAKLALEYVGDNAPARNAAIDFLNAVDRDRARAGDALLSFLSGWLDEGQIVHRTQDVLRDIEAERAQSPDLPDMPA